MYAMRVSVYSTPPVSEFSATQHGMPWILRGMLLDSRVSQYFAFINIKLIL